MTSTGISAKYLDRPLDVSALDTENLDYFRHCAAHDFHLQMCTACRLIRYPPATAGPRGANPDARWVVGRCVFILGDSGERVVWKPELPKQMRSTWVLAPWARARARPLARPAADTRPAAGKLTRPATGRLARPAADARPVARPLRGAA